MDKYFQDDQFRELLQRYEQAKQTDNGGFFDADELTDLAEYYHNQGQNTTARELLERAINTFPGSTLPLVLMSRLALMGEFPDLEEPEYYLAQVIDKSDIEYFYATAEIKVAHGKLEEANFMFEEKKEEIEESDINDYALGVALLYGDYEQFEYADHWLQLVGDTSLADYKELKGRILASKGQFKESEALFNELIDSDPYSAPYWNRLAMTQFMSNNIHDSITSSEYSIAIDPNDAEATLNKANGLYCLGNYEEAQKYFQRYGEIDPKNSDAADLFQALCLINMNRLMEAIPYLNKAEEKAEQANPQGNNRHLQEIYQELAFAYSHLGQLQDALRYVQKIYRLHNSDPNELLVIKGHVYLENNNLNEALECFKQALYDSKLSPSILFKVGASAFDCGYLSMAKNIFLLVAKRVPDEWTDGYSYLARCYYEQGETDEFRQYLAMAVEKNPDEARFILGDLYPEDAAPEDYLNIEPPKKSEWK